MGNKGNFRNKQRKLSVGQHVRPAKYSTLFLAVTPWSEGLGNLSPCVGRTAVVSHRALAANPTVPPPTPNRLGKRQGPGQWPLDLRFLAWPLSCPGRAQFKADRWAVGRRQVAVAVSPRQLATASA